MRFSQVQVRMRIAIDPVLKEYRRAKPILKGTLAVNSSPL
jgi:hypothetical protein